MTLATGTRIGAFEITGSLGAGGMGEVYRARDTRLQRDVALKILPGVFAADPDRLARFEREAQVLASLNHPNIAFIHGVEESNGIRALVLELVEGATLSDRIARGPVSTDEALPIARQIADALAAAHEHGVIHRDLKPGNIKITNDGAVKVLDFGLAKTMAPTAGLDVSQSPTITTPAMTQAGIILGTAAYMSPEQAKGREADKRSDVWAFGCVLYEMLTGRRAFEGEDTSDTLASVLKSDPDWSLVPSEVPHAIRTLLQNCLTKDRRRRVADVSTALFVLDHASRFTASERVPTTTTNIGTERSRWKSVLPIAAAIVITAAVTGAATWALRPSPGQPTVSRFSLTTPNGEFFANTGRQFLAISPDGGQIVYVLNNRLTIRYLSELRHRVIAGTETSLPLNPVFSPDGQTVAFFSSVDNTLRRIPVNGGVATTISAIEPPYGISWGANGIVVGQGQKGIVRFSPNGGSPEQIVTVQGDEVAHGPQMLPDGDAILFTLAKGVENDRWDKAKVVVQSLRSGERQTIIDGGGDGRYLPTGHIVYAVGGTIFAAAFDPRTRKLSGERTPVVPAVRRAGALGVLRFLPGSAQLSVSDTGTLVYAPGSLLESSNLRNLVLADRNGKTALLNLPSGPYVHPRVSSDGKRVVYGRDDQRDADIWVFEISGTSAPRRLTFDRKSRFPIWSPGGRTIAFQTERDGRRAIFTQPVDGGTAEQLTIPEPDEEHVPESWSPDGRRILFSVVKSATYSLWLVTIDDKKTMPFGVQSAAPTSAVFSPDGKWVAYAANEQLPSGKPSPNQGVYLQPFPPTGTKYQAPKRAFDYHPVWAPDSKELFYVPQSLAPMVAVNVQTQPNPIFLSPTDIQSVRSPQVSTDVRGYDVLPDGRFINVVPASEQGEPTPAAREIHVVLNWTEELKRLLPTK